MSRSHPNTRNLKLGKATHSENLGACELLNPCIYLFIYNFFALTKYF